MRRRVKKRTIIAVGRAMLVMVHHMIKHLLPYKEPGDDYFNKMDQEMFKNSRVKRIEKPGYEVELTKKDKREAAWLIGDFIRRRVLSTLLRSRISSIGNPRYIVTLMYVEFIKSMLHCCAHAYQV